ncbi:hypothetical protein C4J96_3350 [Pseudomonas orientalis]|uniref:fimbrial protein n=1 Tax=Pseudomonas orientalis TaxID=76758 RepID=UPI000F6E139E|nr:fimbrial protein [Pseudomonas orientalis]AZE95460.1 hypothetical protein C4J96_3350 [Pseudomonas orientalis]
MKRLLCLSIALLASYMTHATAACVFDQNGKTRIVNFTAPDTINVPMDGTSLTVVDVQVPGPVPGRLILTCNPMEASGFVLNPSLGEQPSGGTVFSIKDSGLDLRLRVEEYSAIPSINQPINISRFNLADRIYRMFLIKNSQIKPGATIPAGLLGRWVTSSGFEIATFNLLNPIKVIAASCETPDVQVNMGEHDLSTFIHNGAFSEAVKFNINLNNCPPGINKVSYLLRRTSTSPVQNSLRGIVKLSADSTAEGLALQVLDGDGNPVVFNQDYQFTNYSSEGGNFNIPLSARYFRVMETGGNGGFDKGMRAGTANASVTFIMSYL